MMSTDNQESEFGASNEEGNVTTTSTSLEGQLQESITISSLAKEKSDEAVAATAALDMTKVMVIMPSHSKKNKTTTASSSAETKRSKRKGRQLWTAKEDEALMIAVLEERKTRDEKEEDEDDLEEDDFEEEEEDWEVIDWDMIAALVTGRSPVECLKRYLKHKKRHEVKAVNTSMHPGNIDVAATALDEKPAATLPTQKTTKRKGGSTVTESEEMTISPQNKKKKEELKWTDDEIGLLSSLADQYQDGKYRYIIWSVDILTQCTCCAQSHLL